VSLPTTLNWICAPPNFVNAFTKETKFSKFLSPKSEEWENLRSDGEQLGKLERSIFVKDLITAVGPSLSLPGAGEKLTANDSLAFLPSGDAPSSLPTKK